MQLKDFVKPFHRMNKSQRHAVIEAARTDRQVSKQVVVARTKKQRVKKQDEAARILESMTPEERAAFFGKVSKR